MFSRRIFLLQLLFLLTACKSTGTSELGKLTLGVVSYGEGNRSTEQYSAFSDYLASQLKTIIELEPAFNEIKALEQIKRRNWSLVFAPPGLATIAIFEEQYVPLLPLEGVANTRSLIVVRQESSVQKLSDLEGKAIAIGQPGSATGYYLPLYNLYGLTLAEIRLAPTPKTVLQWLENQEVEAGALSLADLERHRSEFNSTKFRVIHTDSVPSGSILVSPTIEQYQQERIRKILLSASPRIAEAAGYLPNAKVPNYKRVREVIARVRLIAEQVKKKPVYLHE